MLDIYQTKEWKDIPVKKRYCLLPTMENTKNCLESYDKEAAETLKKFNMDSIERAAKRCITI